MPKLDLKVIPNARKTVLLAESEYGEASTEVDSDFIEQMIIKSDRLRDYYVRSLGETVTKLPEIIADFGTELFSGLFSGDVLALFNRSVGGSEDGKLNIRLLLGEPRLNVIQWELMRSKNEYVGFRHNLIRHPFVTRPARKGGREHKKIRALIIGVDPIVGPQTVHEEHFFLKNLLERLEDQVEVCALFQHEATLDRIVDIMFSGTDIFHFTGHGMFNDNDPGDSYLAVWGDHPSEFGRLSVRTISTLVTSQSVGFCFLNACSTGRTVNTLGAGERLLGAHFVSIAHSLIEAGVPMVLATNHDISVAAATKFSKRFYTSILRYGRHVDDAAREGRAELFMAGEHVLESDWSCPVLYVRSLDLGLGLQSASWEDSFDLYRIQGVRRPEAEVWVASR